MFRHRQASGASIFSAIGDVLSSAANWAGGLFTNLGGDLMSFEMPELTVIKSICGSAIAPAAAGPHIGGGGTSSGRKGSKAKEVIPRTDEVNIQYWCIEQNSMTTKEEVEKKRVYNSGKSPVLLHGVKYDLAAFSKFYDDNKHRVPTHYQGRPTKFPKQFTNNGVVFDFYAETAASLVLIQGAKPWDKLITVGNNSYSSGDLARTDMPYMKVLNAVTSIHTHLPSGTNVYYPYYGKDVINVASGPSGDGGDWSHAGKSKFNQNYFHAIVDDKYIYLYRRKDYEVHKYDRFIFEEIK